MTSPLSRVARWAGPVLALVLAPGPVFAAGTDSPSVEPPLASASVLAAPEAPSAPEPRPPFRVLPAAVSVVPGLLLHGLGSLVGGDTTLAGQLFALEGTGLGLTAAGLVPIALTGASRRTIGPLYALTLSGVGVFSLSAMANLYAAASPAFAPGVAPATLPPLELELGYQHVSDPHFAFRHFLTLGALSRWDALRLEGTAQLSPEDGNTRVRVLGSYRLLGEPERARHGADGTALDVEFGGLVHRYPTEGVTLGGGELSLRGRYAMRRFNPRLAGSFAEMSVGMLFLANRYAGGGGDDLLQQNLLFTFGYGVWLGRGGPLRGEAMLYYDHRKDDFAGGLIALGEVPGHLGLRGRVLFGEHWGAAADLQVGSAYVGKVSLVYALGGEP